MRNDLKLRLRVGLLATACALLALGNVAHAQQARDDDEDTFEQKIIKNILGGIGINTGGSNGIDYRERSPLVIPPSLDLPPPNRAPAAAARDPAWPKNPERQKVVTNKVNRLATPDDPGTSSRLMPDELRNGINPRTASRVTDPSQSGSVNENEIGRPLTPSELNSSSIFNWKALTGNNGEETAQFSGEPTRGSLTEPPPGYQTPSPNQPYGAGKDTRGGWKIPTVLSRPEGSPDQ